MRARQQETRQGTATRLSLPQVTLCAASSVNIAATLRALEACMAGIDFGAVKFFTDASVAVPPAGVEFVPIAGITSARAYSDFMLRLMVDHVETDHCLIVQWDGHVIDAARWRAEFLNHDYIGASWPQFDDGHDVGNGGFSLRSRRLMLACRDPAFRPGHPEDIAVGRTNRAFLEGRGMRFAPRTLADAFSAERAGDTARSLGYHGAWLMPRAIGLAAFWDIYRVLDDRGTIRHDFAIILDQLRRGRGGWTRALRLIIDQLVHRDGRKRLLKIVRGLRGQRT